MKTLIISGCTAALIHLFCAGASGADTVSVETARGPADAPLHPETVAVLDVAAADTIAALGVPIAGLVDPVYVDYLADEAAAAAQVGTLFEPDIEALAALGPDLIVIGGRSYDKLDVVSPVAPAIDMTIWGENHIGQSLARLQAYGKIFGKEAEAASIEAAFTDLLGNVKSLAAKQGTGLILLTNGPKISAYGPGSRFGWLHDAAGITPAVEALEAGTHGQAVSFEFVREANPDWLIVIDRAAAIGSGGAGALETLDNELVHDTTAWREGQIIVLDAAEIYIAGGGIQSMSRVLETVAAAFRGN